MSRPFWLVLYCLAFLQIAGPGHSEDVTLDRFERTTIASDLIQPMELDIAPDGRIFLIELAGILTVIDPKSGQVDVVGKLEVITAQENGLIGMALDPNFSENGWIYLQYSPPNFSGQHISRFTFHDNQLDLASERRLFAYEEQRRECCHHAGSLEFGPDGNLYIGTGDNTNPFDSQGYAPTDEREDRSPWDAQRSAGNTKSYNGKVLRIRPEPDGTYSIPDGNLFPKGGSIGHPELYVMGCRNPWRINVDQKTGYLYWGDVGPDAGSENERGPRGYDELNQAREAGNFGWPYFIGDNFPYSRVNFATGEIGAKHDPQAPRNESVNNTGSVELPPAQAAMIYYPSAASTEFPELGSGRRTACAGPVYDFDAALASMTKFPDAYDRTLFAFEWSRNKIYAVHLDTKSHVDRIEPFLPEMTFSRRIDLQFDASGSLVLIEYGETWGVNPDARLVRIDYVRGNRSPLAVATSTNTMGREPLQVQLNGDRSIDKDGDALSYKWSLTRTNLPEATSREIATTANASVEITEPGVYTAMLEVRDTMGAVGVTSLPVIVGNSRPTIEFVEPLDGDFYTPGEPIRYSVVVRDMEDGTSDFEETEEGEYPFIDALAPTRMFVEAMPVSEASQTDEAPGMLLIRKTDCLNCHAPNRTLVGPSFVDIANKYRDQPHQVDVSVSRVMKGSTGVWGKVGMLPHSQHTVAEVRQMVEYVFSVTADSSNASAMGFNNSLPTEKDSRSIQLLANYADAGRGEIPKLIGSATITLRSRNLQAESADEFRGTQKLGSDQAQGKHFMGAIEHDGFLKFTNIPLNTVKQVVVRVASAGAGGVIELHRSTADGPLLGSTTVEVNGDWTAFYEKTIELVSTDGRDSLYVVFKNEKNRGGLMNIDSLNLQATH